MMMTLPNQVSSISMSNVPFSYTDNTTPGYYQSPLVSYIDSGKSGQGSSYGANNVDETVVENVLENKFNQSGIHHQTIEEEDDVDDSDDNYEEDEEWDGENENEIGNSINCFVLVQYSCPGLKSQKLHRVARITDEKLVDGEVQFTVNFYEKNLQSDDKFVPCISNLKTNININEDDIIVWLSDPIMDSCDDGLKFPFDFKNFNV